MSVPSNYLPASFKGVPFLLRTEKSSGGKKVVVHNYPGSNKKFVEELGAIAPDYSFEALVHGPRAAEDAEDLEQVMNEAGVGDLVHPIKGFLRVKSTTWERTTSEKEMGEIKFTLNFSTSEANISLSLLSFLPSQVSDAASLARQVGSAVTKATIAVNKIKSGIETLQTVSTTIMGVINGDIKSLSDLDPEALAAFDRVFTSNVKNIYNLALSAEDLVDSFDTFYTTGRATTVPEIQRLLWLDNSTFEIDRIPGPVDTAIRLNQENNTAVLNENTRVNALINAYESTAFSSFLTTDELEEARKSLDDLFDELFSGGSPLADSNELRSAVLDLRTLTNGVLDQSDENAFRIETISPGEVSLAQLVYELYGDLDNLDLIRNLNPNVDHAQLSLNDTLRILS